MTVDFEDNDLSTEEWIEQIIEMSKSKRVELYNKLQFKLMLLKEKLTALSYLTGTSLGRDKERILNTLIRKGLLRNTWVFTDQQIADFVDKPLEIVSIDLKYLVIYGWLVNQRNQYTLSNKAKEVAGGN